jgi:hypothetical protein
MGKIKGKTVITDNSQNTLNHKSKKAKGVKPPVYDFDAPPKEWNARLYLPWCRQCGYAKLELEPDVDYGRRWPSENFSVFFLSQEVKDGSLAAIMPHETMQFPPTIIYLALGLKEQLAKVFGDFGDSEKAFKWWVWLVLGLGALFIALMALGK